MEKNEKQDGENYIHCPTCRGRGDTGWWLWKKICWRCFGIGLLFYRPTVRLTKD